MSVLARDFMKGAIGRGLAALGFAISCLLGCGDPAGPAPGEWVDYHLPKPGLKVSLWAAGPERIWVLGAGGGPHLIEDGEPRPLPDARAAVKATAPSEVRLIWGTSDQDIWIDSLAHFDGVAWKLYQPFRSPWSGGALWGSDPQHYYLVSGDLLSVYDGKTWSKGDNALALDLPLGSGCPTGIHGSGPDDVHVVMGNTGKLVHFDGKDWTRKDSPVAKASYRAVWVRSPGEAWAVGAHPEPAGMYEGPGLVISWNGQEWKLEESPDQELLYHVTGCDDRVFVATNHKVYERQGKGPWRSIFKVTEGYLLHDVHCASRALLVTEARSSKETIVWVRY